MFYELPSHTENKTVIVVDHIMNPEVIYNKVTYKQ